MSVSYISAALRKQTRERAGRRCEYCLPAEEHAFLPYEADHIVAEKHGGATDGANLAWSCFDCNRFKGSDVASFDPLTNELSALFHPRTQQWAEHFQAV